MTAAPHAVMRVLDDQYLDRPFRVLTGLGALSVVAGGVVAAVTGPLELDKGSWLAAYLVLVSGVSQFVIGQAPARLAVRPISSRWAWSLVASWNLGNAAVISGTLLALPQLVDVGSVLLVLGLGIAAFSVRGGDPSTRALGWAYRFVLLVLAISIPIGVLLAHVRHSA
jgi:hypothetical protein